MSTSITSGVKNGAASGCEQTKDILLECKKAMQDEKKQKQGSAEAALETRVGQLETRDSKVCILLKSEEASRFYRNLDLYAAIDATCTVEAVQKNVDDQIKKSDDLSKALAEASKCIKIIKDKAAELKAKACDFDTQLNDDCNKEQLRILNCNFFERCSYKEGFTKDDAFEKMAIEVIEKAKAVSIQAAKTFHASAEISGIQTFSNVKSLKDMSKSLVDTIKAFKTDVDTNVKDRAGEVTKAQEDLAKAVKDLATKTLERNKATTIYEGVAFTLEFVCDDDRCKGVPSLEDIPNLCNAFTNCFCSPEGEKTSNPGKSNYNYSSED
jgi:hypothetical protein